MREIKFRGVSVVSGEFVFGCLVEHPDGSCFIANPVEITSSLSGWREFASTMEEVHKNTVGQYTGLRDKNGVEIYEGDICLVVTNGSCYQDSEKRVIAYEESKFNIGQGAIDSAYKYEVIGNIHQNQELLT